jgi:uncharacterized membrane-anchored protein
MLSRSPGSAQSASGHKSVLHLVSVRNKNHQGPTGVTIKDTDKMNCLGEVVFTPAEGCPGAEAKQAHRVGYLQFYPQHSGSCPSLGLVGAWVHNLFPIG